MSRCYVIICYRIKKLCIKLVNKTSLYYDARSEKHQICADVEMRRARPPFPLTPIWRTFTKGGRLVYRWRNGDLN
jgi:hypothetical protein